MAKIRKKFRYNLPDEYLSQESTLGLKAEWTYEGPDKIWVFVDYKTNKILSREGFRDIDDENPEKQYEDLEVYTGLNSYPVLITFDDDAPLLSAVAQLPPLASDLPQKEYRLPGSDEVFYSRPNPTTPDHTIEIADCEYDPTLKKWKKPYPWRVPHITRDQFLAGHSAIVEDAKMVRSKAEVYEWTEEQIAKWDAYTVELEGVLEKYADYLETPWMVPFPNDPRLDPEWKDFVDADPDSANLQPPDPEPKVIYPEGADPYAGTVNLEYNPNETVEESGRLPGEIDWTKVTDPSVAATQEGYNPNARDGDGDGIVQEGTPFERPAS
jgi:hypothetical protein